MNFVLHHNDVFFFYSVYLLLVMHCDLVFLLVLLFSCWLCITSTSCVVYCSLHHCFSHIVALFFSCLHYLIVLLMLLHYSFHVVELFFFSMLLLYFSRPYLDVLYALPHYSFCIALAIFFALCLLFFSCCHVASLLSSHYRSSGVGAQPSSTYWANSWCCSSHIVVTSLLVLLLFLFPWLVWYFHSPSYHM
jgi:hypothetical protein